MNTIFIPLGLIVDTKVERSIGAFAGLCRGLDLGITIDDEFLRSISPQIQKYIFGAYEKATKTVRGLTPLTANEDLVERAFSDDLLRALLQHPKFNTNKRECLLREWPKLWRDLWNAQCRVSDDCIALARKIAEIAENTEQSKIRVVIISETNPTHLRHIFGEFTKAGINRTKFTMLLSYTTKENTVDMLTRFLNATLIKSNHQNIFITGNPTHIQNPLFRQLAIDKESRIDEVAQRFNVRMVKLPNALTPEMLDEIVTEIKTDARYSAPSPRLSVESPPPRGPIFGYPTPRGSTLGSTPRRDSGTSTPGSLTQFSLQSSPSLLDLTRSKSTNSEVKSPGAASTTSSSSTPKPASS